MAVMFRQFPFAGGCLVFGNQNAAPNPTRLIGYLQVHVLSLVAKLLSCAGFLLLALVAPPASAHSPSTLGPVTTQVAAGESHTCALITTGAVLCWGENTYGQLGNNSTTGSAMPGPVSGLSSGVAAIAAGQFHTCALSTTGGVLCWGLNSSGQLGNHSTSSSDVPVTVSGLGSGVVAIAVGANHTCALTTAGAVTCWGLNFYGQLGNSSAKNSLVPVAVSTLGSGVVAIAAGAAHTCALTTTGGVQCWGLNSAGQLGNHSTTTSRVPVPVSKLTGGVAAITTGANHTCALTTAGGAQCWGDNTSGELGNHSTQDSDVPVAVSGLGSDVAVIAAGDDHTCASTTAGAVKCWGDNGYGELGNHSNTDSHVPVQVNTLGSGVAAIAASGNHSCALITTGAVQCWGRNDNGELGNNANTNSDVPVAVSILDSGVAAIAAGYLHTCALTTAGAVLCWGFNAFGQLGDNSTSDSNEPVPVSGLSGGVMAISAGYLHTCALTTAGAVLCWGGNDAGQLGNNSTTSSTIPVAVVVLVDNIYIPISGVVAIAAGEEHTCALTTSGGVQCWGDNQEGQLGNNSSMASTIPVSVVALAGSNYTSISGVTAIESGLHHTCALTTTAAVLCWGENGYGQLGNHSTSDSHVAVAVVVGNHNTPLGGVAAISAGDGHTCALTELGAVLCWGFNYYGQLGNNSTSDSHVSVPVSNLSSGVAAISAGDENTCALTTMGAVKCWGFNGDGELGNNSTTQSNVPAAVSNLSSGVAAIATGYYHTCALTTAGVLQCWGDNVYGDLGDGTTAGRLTPVAIAASQSIIFHPPMSLGQTIVDLSATATSGGTVTFDTWTPDTCAVSGHYVVSLQAPEALCGIRASQAGGTRAAGGSDAPAPQQLRLIRISDFIFANGFDN